MKGFLVNIFRILTHFRGFYIFFHIVDSNLFVGSNSKDSHFIFNNLQKKKNSINSINLIVLFICVNFDDFCFYKVVKVLILNRDLNLIFLIEVRINSINIVV